MSARKSDVVIVVTAIPLGVGAYIWGAYVTTVLWAWFITPVFALPTINIVQAMGIGLVWTAFKWSGAKMTQVDQLLHPERSVSDRYWTNMGTAYLAPLFFLTIGYVVAKFM